jgi:hypothetical protein
MAKRFKVKGKAPRGLSKRQRVILDASKKEAENPFTLTRDLNKNWSNTRQQMEEAGKDIASRPSSTRKKRVKEGSRKFIGPRQFKSELREDRDARDRTGGEILIGNDGEPEGGRWVEGEQYARLKPNKRLTPNQRALRRSERRNIDTRLLDIWQGMDPTLPIEKVPANLRDLIRRKIKDPSSQKRMLRVLARAMRARGGRRSETDWEKDFQISQD